MWESYALCNTLCGKMQRGLLSIQVAHIFNFKILCNMKLWVLLYIIMAVSSELGLSFLVSMQRMYSSLAVSIKDKQIQINYTPFWINFQVFEL